MVGDLEVRGPEGEAIDDKYHRSDDEPAKVCPAPLGEELMRRVEDIALGTFRACHCRDYARVDIRIDGEGRPWVLEINSMASLGAGGSFVRAAERAGYPFAALVNRIVEVAWERYAGGPPPPVERAAGDDGPRLAPAAA
jgi:D-alanine-D-alanine ligase